MSSYSTNWYPLSEIQDIITGSIGLAADSDFEMSCTHSLYANGQMLIFMIAVTAAATSLLALPLRCDQVISENFAAWLEAAKYVAALKLQNKYHQQDVSYASPQWIAAVTAQGYNIQSALEGYIFSHYIGWNTIRCYLLSELLPKYYTCRIAHTESETPAELQAIKDKRAATWASKNSS